jgi:DNA-binding MarR family transcriptional regulator
MGIHEAIKQQNFKSAHEQMFVNILYTANWLESRTRDLFKSYGVTQPQYNVLRILKGSHPKPLSASDIKTRMIDQSPDLTRMIDRLLDKNLVTRRVCPANRRQIEIGISEKGLKMLEQIHPILEERMGFLKALSDDEALKVSDLLDKLRDILED